MNKHHYDILDFLTDDDIKEMRENHNLTRLINDRIREAKQSVKPSGCLICGNAISSTCNSHSVPRFCLDRIADKGKVLTANNLTDLPLIKTQDGINRTGTFHLICDSCDNSVFSDYENIGNYNGNPTDIMLNQIALKNCLKLIDKRSTEIAMHSLLEKDYPQEKHLWESRQRANQLDISEFEDELNYAKKAVKKKNKAYHLYYYETLNYVVPVAFQGQVALAFDLEGKLVNDLYYYSPDYKIEMLNICVFPMKEKSVIMMFVKDGVRRYSNFFKQFNTLTHDDKLAVIFYILVVYSEDYFMSETAKKVIEGSKALQSAGMYNTDLYMDSHVQNPVMELKSMYDLNKRDGIPNLLSEEYKLEVE